MAALSGFLLVLASVLASTAPITMGTKPLARTQFAPNNNIRAAYNTFIPSSAQAVDAYMDITTKTPALNLDNFLDITDIQCHSGNEIVLTFSSAEVAAVAKDNWSKTENLSFYLNHERQCLGVAEVQAFSIS
ncbi:hypothetical protein HDU91_007397, partial [Kappamyces sp. JEL0680]